MKSLPFMRPLFLVICQFFAYSLLAQQITFSDPVRDNTKNMDFEIIGKMNKNILILATSRQDYTISVYDNDMRLKENVKLDFFPDKTYNVDIIAYPDFFYLIYEYQKKGVIYCNYVKLDATAKKMAEPVLLDTTHVGALGDSKIYTILSSENKEKILVLKIHKKNEHYNFLTLLYDKEMQLQKKTRMSLPESEDKEDFGEFLVDNDGVLVFTQSTKESMSDYVSVLDMIYKSAMADSFTIRRLPLNKKYIDEVRLKVDNVNKRYLINSFYYPKKKGNIQGLYSAIWDKSADSCYISSFIPLDDTVRANVKSEGALKYAFNDFYIRNVLVKKDGGYIIIAEDYVFQNRTGASPWNRWNNFYGSPYINPNNYYMSTPSSYNSYYHQYNNDFYGNQSRSYYNNILVLMMSNNGQPNWSSVVYKDQYSDPSDDYYSSFLSFVSGGQLHFLFNTIEKQNQILNENCIVPDGSVLHKPTLRSMDKGFEFMPRLGKQVSAKQVIIPCTNRGLISFAKVEY